MLNKFSFLFVFLMMFGCSNKKKETTPNKETKEVIDTSSDSENTDKGVPADYENSVTEVWASGLNAVKNCVSKEIAKTHQKGLEGFIIMSADIGIDKNPKNLKIDKNELKVKNIDGCITEYLKDLEFPTWGYKVHYKYSYSISILY